MITNYGTESFYNENPGELIREHRQWYLLVNVISKRVRQLQTGDRALALPPDGNRDPLYIAQQEFLEDKLEILPKQALIQEQGEVEEQETVVIDFENDAPTFDFNVGLDDSDEDL